MRSLVMTSFDHRTISRHNIIFVPSVLLVGHILVLENTIKASDTKNLWLSILSRLFPPGKALFGHF